MSETNQEDAPRELLISILHLALLPAIVLGSAALDCWAAAKVWGWFLAPTFGAFPAPAVFFGAWFLASILTHQRNPPPKEKALELLGGVIGWAFLRPLATVAFAWIVWKVLA